MTARVGRAAADEQERNRRVHPDSAGAGSYPRSAAHQNAPICSGLQRRDIQRTSLPVAKNAANYSVAIQVTSSQSDGNAGVIAGPRNEGTAVKLAVKLPSK